jgi:succinate dehydrogenase / fumarate reductase iron-sulfur subunit
MIDVSLRIFRFKPGQQPHYDVFTVLVAEEAYVLDALDAVWAKDHSLTYRRACHHSACGVCAVRIDGTEKLPCVTRVSEVWNGHSERNPLRIEPLRNFPLVSDLVVDVKGLFQRMSASDLEITRDSEPTLPLSVDDLEELHAHVEPEPVEPPENLSHFNRFESCIECGICMSACPTVAADDRFLGPAGLAAIYNERQKTNDPREVAHLLALADGEHGVWRCHSAFECTEACPQAVDPASKIMALRRELIANRLSKGGRK